MITKTAKTIGAGLRYTRDNHQLWYTVFVALVIFLSFFFMVQRFVMLAEDSAERLINVRVGSIQDAFVVFAQDEMDNPASLTEKVEAIASRNATIQEFDVVKIVGGAPIIIASLDTERLSKNADVHTSILSLATSDPGNSFTVEEHSQTERFFSTVRAITNDTKEVVGYAITRQTLSEADKQIAVAIRNSLIAFSVIVVVLILLFFRYARVVDYATLYRKLQGIDKLKDEFIAMASHELRSPLTSIRGYTELIRTGGKLNEEQMEYALRVEKSAGQLNDLVNDMLDVSRLQEGRMRFENVDFNIEEMITEVVEAFRPMAEKKGLKLKKDGLEEHILHLDKMKIHRVLVNLVSNAVKYTPMGSVTVSFKRIGDKIEVRVSDTGIGISREDQERLFEKFHRIRSAETEHIQGTGLGLWLSREIIRKQKGDIQVESIQGVGTHFILTLPTARG